MLDFDNLPPVYSLCANHILVVTPLSRPHPFSTEAAEAEFCFLINQLPVFRLVACNFQTDKQTRSTSMDIMIRLSLLLCLAGTVDICLFFLLPLLTLLCKNLLKKVPTPTYMLCLTHSYW